MASKLCMAYGAEVIRPLGPSGEPFRAAAPLLPQGGSALDAFLNHGKARDGHVPFDAAIGDSAALGEYARETTVKVRLSVYGPGEDPPTSELALAALSGLLGIVGEADDPPTRLAGHQLAYAAGLSACTGLLAAFLAGGEEIVDVSLFDVAVWLNWKGATGMLIEGMPLKRGNLRNYWQVMRAKDGYVALVYQEKDWPALCEMIDDPRLGDARFATTQARAANLVALRHLLEPWFAARSRADITRGAQSRRIPIGPVLAPVELLANAQYEARGALGPDAKPRLPLVWDGRRIDVEAFRAA
ncbi:CoA transferase [Methylocapsa sp. S129]|uniref:CoA transferase n=1 Tax=Methylocapsa sp. S129 TaxID=1641869 RepID=UPI00131DD87F|nr:CoA transferase [Methylocapsa sp. S129]